MGNTKEIKTLLGKRIKELRTLKGLSQQKLAEMIDIDQRNLSCIECGSAFPSRCLFELSKALNIELYELFDFSHLKLNTIDMKEYIKGSLNNLSEDNIKIVYKFIKSMQ